MIGTGIVIAVALIFFAGGLYLLMIRPAVDKKTEFAPFESTYIAHRGLFDNDSDAPENTLPAFQRAIDAGFGIELDVQRTGDGKLVVFHDWDMRRMAGADLKITEHIYEELCRYPLGKSEERLPLFEDVLRMIDGAVPLVVEIKVGFRYLDTTAAVAEMLETYNGLYCIECFNPLALAWYRRNVPNVLRGLLSMDFYKEPVKIPGMVKFVLTNLMLNFRARPDFISYNYRDKDKKCFRLCRRLFKVKTAAWTVKSEQDLKDARRLFDIFIFDSFMPFREKKNENENSEG